MVQDHEKLQARTSVKPFEFIREQLGRKRLAHAQVMTSSLPYTGICNDARRARCTTGEQGDEPNDRHLLMEVFATRTKSIPTYRYIEDYVTPALTAIGRTKIAGATKVPSAISSYVLRRTSSYSGTDVLQISNAHCVTGSPQLLYRYCRGQKGHRACYVQGLENNHPAALLALLQ